MTHPQGDATQGRAGKEGTTNLSVCRLTRARQSPAAAAHARRARWGRVAALAVALAWWVVLAATPLHAQCFDDGQGADDEAGQKDLSQFCVLGSCSGGSSASWHFDDTNWTGNNTGDACALFDTDGDGKVNRAVCVTIVNPAQMQAGNPKCYTCGDTRPDRCTSPVLTTCTSTCAVASDTDPFEFVPSHLGNKCHGTNCRTLDTQTTCCLTQNDAGAGGVLIEVCSFPSQEPNSDPSDCIVNPPQCHHDDDEDEDDDEDCDDDNPCTVDTCDTTITGGVCHHVAGNAGAQCRGAAGVCDVAEFCTGTSIHCPADHFAQSGVCRNASDVCDVAESCNGTSADCPADGVKAQGTSCRVSADQCDVAEVCDGSTKACPPDGFKPNNTPCNDSNACTTPDVCTNGSCVGGPPKNCNDGNGCTDDGCNPASGCTHVNNNDPCNDGNACTTADACAGGGCVGGPAPDCNDLDVCTDDSCNTTTGCVHTNNTAGCDDGNECTGPDTCSNDNCTGAIISCDDGNVCTTDGCNPASGCTHTGVPGCCNVDSECADTDQCTMSEKCVNHACVSAPVDCNDNNPCTDDGCNPATGCTHVNNNDACNDGNACTDGDACAGSSCHGAFISCNDNNVCTTDSCNPASGCVSTNNTVACSDDDNCTTNDHCSGGVCVGGPPPVCNDFNPCTDDACVSPTGCASTNNTAPCSDEDPCTENDVCAGGNCTSGTPKDCNDFDLCTDDNCNPQTGACEHLNNAAPCDDGNVCTDGDLCVDDSCTGAFPKDCSDGNECTTDFCTPTTDCQHTGIPGCCNTDIECADTDACTTNEHCDVNHTCVSDPIDCTDTNPCTVDFCDSFGGFGCQNPLCPQVPNAPCPPECFPPPLCGNGVLDPGETCDPPDPTPLPGVNPAQPTCRTDCTFCGDSVVDAEFGEICDDGTTAVGCTPKGFPVDPLRCQNNCTPPACKDPTIVKLAANIDKYNFHGRLAVASPVDFLTHTFAVELTDPLGRVIYRASLPAGSLVSTSGNPAGPFSYVDVAKQSKISGGIYKITIKDQVQKSGFYRATVVAYGNLLASQTDMVQHVYGGNAEWTVTGIWVRKSPTTWKFVPTTTP